MWKKRERKDPADEFYPKPSTPSPVRPLIENGLPIPGQPKRSWLPWAKERNY